MTEPEPMTLTEVNRAIIDASRTYIAEQRAHPRDEQAAADAKADLDALIAYRDALPADA